MAWNKAFLSHQMQNYLRQAVAHPSQIIMYTYTFRLKYRAWNSAFLGRIIQNFLRQGGMQPQKLKNTYKSIQKRPEIKHF